MAKVGNVSVSSGLESSFNKSLKTPDRFVNSTIGRRKTFMSRSDKKRLKNQSVFVKFSDDWQSFSSEVKNNWKTVGSEIGLTNWQCFIHDTSARRASGLSGFSTPSLLHQGNVGHLHIGNPDCEIKIEQKHPRSYFVKQKETGSYKYSPVRIDELFSLPLQIRINYFSDLSIVGPDPFAIFYADIWHSYQGVDYYTKLKIDFDFETLEWTTDNAVETSLIGQVISYNLYFHINDLQGDLYFDNIEALHTEQNWVRDSRCDEIEKSFSLYWSQIAKHWSSVTVGNDSYYKSEFINF